MDVGSTGGKLLKAAKSDLHVLQAEVPRAWQRRAVSRKPSEPVEFREPGVAGSLAVVQN